MTLREECNAIVTYAVARVRPDEAVRRALKKKNFGEGKLIIVSVGKAAWNMAKAAEESLDSRIYAGIVITKYGHSQGPIDNFEMYEAAHPIPDAAGFAATARALELTEGLSEKDTVIFLLSGGGSALFEKPLIPCEELRGITEQLLACGADITEINTIRKRLSSVKGGKFAQHCAPAKVFSIVLSDVLGNHPDVIASGPTYPDKARPGAAEQIVKKYGIQYSPEAYVCLQTEPVHTLNNVETELTGSVQELCFAAREKCEELGYECVYLTDQLSCEAREAGRFLAAIAATHQNTANSLAFILGGETVVHLTGKGKGGRNQELALAAAEGIDGFTGTAIFSFGSDGTDGPTDAAGGFVTGETAKELRTAGMDIEQTLEDNDAYHALQKCGGLLFTGPTGTNVNDVTVLLLRRTGVRP